MARARQALTSAVIAGDLATASARTGSLRRRRATLLGCMALALVMNSLVLATMYAILLGASGGFSRIVAAVTWAHFSGRRGLGRAQGSP